VLLTVLGAWLVSAVLVAILFAAIGRSALREDQALGHLPSHPGKAGDVRPTGPDVPGNPLSPGPEERTLRA